MIKDVIFIKLLFWRWAWPSLLVVH